MLIYVPMAGFGDRYMRAGYKEPKPLIPVDGVTMIERVLQAFTPRQEGDRYLFTVNRQHAESTNVEQRLRELVPDAKIVVVEPHKDGPIQTLLASAEHIDPNEDVLLNYCDFGVDWSYPEFRAWLAKHNWDGAMSAYKGFHPHSLGPQLYAYMRVADDGETVTEIREKHHFTPDKFSEYASSGLYYFRTGRQLLDIAKEMVASGERVQGEFYVSMAVQALIAKQGRVGVFPLAHFYQWGTPDDLRDWEGWSKSLREIDGFAKALRSAESKSVHIVPMAGRGQRFSDQGYADPKPLIDVAGRPMIAQVLSMLPKPKERVLVALGEHAGDSRFQATVREASGTTRIVPLTQMTEGQASTAALGLEGLADNVPLLFAPCDAGYLYDLDAFLRLEAEPDCDLAVFTAKGHLPAIWRPQMYGWVQRNEAGFAVKAAVKKLVEGVDAREQEVVTGTFWFKDKATFLKEHQAMLAANDRVNNEFYIDTIARRMIEGGRKVRAFTVSKYIPWGTPEELRTFQYWNDVFSRRPRIVSAQQERDDALDVSTRATTGSLKAKAQAQVRELGRFVVVGCSAVATDGLVYFLLAGLTAAWIAKTVSFVAGAALAFVLNRGFVFRATGALKAQVLGFCLLYLVSLLLNAGVNELALGMAVAKPIAWFLATATSTVSNFLGMKFIVFRTNKRIEPS